MENITREYIEQLNDIEPYCFETDREEQWFNVGLKYGLDVADSNPKSPWINVEDDLPCNHEELIRHPRITKYVMVMYKDGSVALDRMVKRNDGYWRFVGAVTHWFPMPKLPNRRIDYGKKNR